MSRHRLHSGAIAAFEYFSERRVLEIEFKDGQVWRYFPIEAASVEELLAAPSAGEYFNRFIRDAAQFREHVP